jgi:hypothetical protein
MCRCQSVEEVGQLLNAFRCCADGSIGVPISDTNEDDSGKTAGQHWQPNPSRVKVRWKMQFAARKFPRYTSAE